jgi:phosphatidylglycerol---prolipoprotein diacylglyceryl transferase
MKPEIHILGLSIKTFGVAFACGFLAAGAIVARRFKELGKPVDWAYELTFAALVGGLVGSRGYYLIQHWSSVKHDLIGSIFSGSGLVWYGGALGGAICVLAWAWWRGFLNGYLLDLAAIPLALGYAIGRIGCQISGDGDYGKPFHGVTAMGYPHGTVPTPAGVTVYPTPIYETVAMALVAWALWRMRDRVRPGLVFASYLVLAGGERFLIEFLRRNDRVAAGLTAPQFESLALLALGLVWLAFVARRSRGVWAPSPAG